MRATHWLVAVALSLLAQPLFAINGEDEPDSERLQGTWLLTYAEKAGMRAPESELKDCKLIFSANRFTGKLFNHEVEGPYALNTTKDPRQIVLKCDAATLTGIYAIDGDELKICAGHDDDPPLEFATSSDQKRILLVLRRRKP